MKDHIYPEEHKTNTQERVLRGSGWGKGIIKLPEEEYDSWLDDFRGSVKIYNGGHFP